MINEGSATIPMKRHQRQHTTTTTTNRAMTESSAATNIPPNDPHQRRQMKMIEDTAMTTASSTTQAPSVLLHQQHHCSTPSSSSLWSLSALSATPAAANALPVGKYASSGESTISHPQTDSHSHGYRHPQNAVMHKHTRSARRNIRDDDHFLALPCLASPCLASPSHSFCT